MSTSMIQESGVIATLMHNMALKDFQVPSGLEFNSQQKYVWLRHAGSMVWLDTGDALAAEKVWAAEATALTTNNALVNQMVQKGVMDDVIAEGVKEIRKVKPDISVQEMVYEIGFLVNAKLALGLVQKFNTHVSVELHPDVAFDIEGTLALARRYFAINPEWFYVKVPMTQEGLLAVRILSKENIPVNLTIGFSARQNYLAARLSNPSFVNVFLGRLNSLVEENSLGSPINVGEKATLASDEMMKNLRSSGSVRTNQIAASIRSGSQIPTLAGVDVYTIPPKSAAEYLALDVSQDDIQYRNWRDLPVELQASGVIHPSAFNVLWEIDKEYISFVDEVVKNVDTINIGSDLDRIARKHGVNVFHDWTAEERNRIREQGKIPQVHDWPGISIDTLMTMAALECFAKDQIEVDDRIRHMIS